MNLYIIILIILMTIFSVFIIFIYTLKNKIEILENIIIKNFKERNNFIPSIYEVTKIFLIKHDEIFSEILKLRKKDFSENTFYYKIIEKINTHKQIHNELNFIFKICNKNHKINNDAKYLYIRDSIIDKSLDIGNNLEIYKKIIKKFNKIILIKNLTIIGLLFPIEKKYFK